jgi:hypothetical protein
LNLTKFKKGLAPIAKNTLFEAILKALKRIKINQNVLKYRKLQRLARPLGEFV